MKLLCLDTATPATVVAVVDTDSGSATEELHIPEAGERPAHTASLHRYITAVLKRSKLELSELDLVVVGVGPGSFTGLRVGVSAVRALAQATGLEVVPVSTLSALALSSSFDTESVIATVIARKGEYFVGEYSNGSLVGSEQSLKEADLVDFCRSSANRFGSTTCVGNAALELRSELQAVGVVVPSEHGVHSVGAIGLAEAANGLVPVNYLDLVPAYLNAPNVDPPKLQTKK